MTDLILKTRLAALDNNLQQVRDLVTVLQKRKEQIDALQGHLDTSSARMREYMGRLGTLESSYYRTEFDSVLVELKERAREIDRGLVAMEGIIAKLQQTIFFRITRNQAINQDLRTKVTERLEGYDKATAAIRMVLDKRPPNRAQAWQEYHQSVRGDTQSLLSEYMEFIGGLALRDVGLDEGISELADELMQTFFFRNARWSLLSVPARQHAASMTLTRIIRLGFPEWTTWALPLTAHEFWYAVAREMVSGSLAKTNGLDLYDPRIQECLADGFATYAMGPAYAYAAVLLRLDPCFAYTDTNEYAAHDNRVHVILSMLRHMDAVHGSEEGPYAMVTEELSREWESALEFTTDQGTPQNEVKQQLESAVGDFFQILEKETASVFTVSNFHTSRDWSEKLVEDRVGEIEVPRAAEFRWVVNAAWLARVRVARDEGRSQSDRDTEIQKIAERAQDLWAKVRRVLDEPPPSFPPPTGPRFPPQPPRRH